ncbi:helix-turn-helix domain-containing protein [Curvibacter sp. CHRR-16]|uniref:DNA-3-methyladenine glycosylase 2 family protein n=1 Tax=Curvibacter sp. CHRR-16 TaxID=2835872 RepID=UPI001BDA3C36|nr:AlkA N-terminal domain-containing protein [Curvibacter sp. CHRR-16]MBT0569798.1 helix-turn-helix domain-containing protein [Curvibacter sp. CHRR-16]
MPSPLSPTANTASTTCSTSSSDDAGYYLALKARDARFDGRFFTGVTSTGIYCRPVCKVRTPKAENCRFFTLASQAEAAGFRPCMRCRPELAPSGLPSWGAQTWSVQDASAILARQAAQLLDAPQLWSDGAPSMGEVAQRLGISERHLRRIFELQWGITPLQYLQTRRLLTAKQLLTDTQLPIAQVALLSGFASVRRFHSAFAAQYRLQPRALRSSTAATRTSPTGLRLRAAYRPPLDEAALLQFFAQRSLAGVEVVDASALCMARTLTVQAAGHPLQGWVLLQLQPAHSEVHMTVSDTLASALPQVMARMRHLLDLDADPQAIHTVLQATFPNGAGLRVPGTVDGFELAVRAILGQQITVQAARTLGSRLVQRFGTLLAVQAAQAAPPVPGLTHLFPSPEQLRHASDDSLGSLGIVRQRQHAIRALAAAVADGQLHLHPGADVPATMAALQTLPGIGAWTAHYIAMRALRWPDAFPAGDVALQKALGVRNAPRPALAAEQASQTWRPWRSYATVRAWSQPSGESS